MKQSILAAAMLAACSSATPPGADGGQVVVYLDRLRVLKAAPFAQTNHLAVALADGGAIVLGGNVSESIDLPDSTLTQIFEPASETFVRGPELPLSVEAQIFTSIAPLRDGGFILAGTGINAPAGALASVATQLFDPASRSFTRAGNAATRGSANRTATALLDGALLTGGSGSNVIPVSTSDRYDAATQQWHATGRMLHVRQGHTATLLRDGRVLISGGLTCCSADASNPLFVISTAELYDPATDSFTAAGSMLAARFAHAAALLPDGRVLISGGDGDEPDEPPLQTEIYDPATQRFTPAGELRAARDSHAAVTLADGRVLVIGGEVPPTKAGRVGTGIHSTEIFAGGNWSQGPSLENAFFGATVTLLSNGKVLIFGGADPGGFPQAAATLFE
ncbi:MAG TPA: hypothetical protein VH083_07525 [Myxococcales bacterium]|jgi:hypothetical protein|nr:hypothetical protein [Myxococcales bacterium]